MPHSSPNPESSALVKATFVAPEKAFALKAAIDQVSNESWKALQKEFPRRGVADVAELDTDVTGVLDAMMPKFQELLGTSDISTSDIALLLNTGALIGPSGDALHIMLNDARSPSLDQLGKLLRMAGAPEVHATVATEDGALELNL